MVAPALAPARSAAQLVASPPWSPVAAKSSTQAAHLAELFAARFPRLAARAGNRVARAVSIVATPGACRRTARGVIMVKSQSNSSSQAWYQVDLDAKTCTCPDSGQGHLCKHRIACAMHIYGPDWIREEQAELIRRIADLQRRKDAIRIAWARVLELAQTLTGTGNCINPESGVYPTAAELAALRVQLMEAEEIALDLTQKFNALAAQAKK